MNNLRRVHLYLGCVFAPLLTFFAISGIWQTLGVHWKQGSYPLALLSTIHMSRGLKGTTDHRLSSLTSPALHWFVVAMALSFIVTMILGVIMAFRFGRGIIVVLCLAAGVCIPLAMILMSILAQR